MDANEFLQDAKVASGFKKRVAEIVGGRDIQLMDKSDEELVARFSIVQYAANILLAEIEERGLIKHGKERPLSPMVLPPGVDPVDHIFTKK